MAAAAVPVAAAEAAATATTMRRTAPPAATQSRAPAAAARRPPGGAQVRALLLLLHCRSFVSVTLRRRPSCHGTRRPLAEPPSSQRSAWSCCLRAEEGVLMSRRATAALPTAALAQLLGA